jgi:uncharacterized protein (DUF433 family)
MATNWRDRIELNPAVLVGKPVVKATRISVELVLEMLAGGIAEEAILQDYPRLTHEDILACVAYAVDLVKSERSFPLSA